ncbi:MAG: hypothetical protein HOV66_00415 [Streptomycetaceae bacterium]|nr:hypothetical protein [Streptomycetaceae bacterium]
MAFAQLDPAADHTTPGPQSHGPGGPFPHATAWLMLCAAVVVLTFVLRRLAAGTRADSSAGSARHRGPAPALFPGAFLIPPPLVLRT